MTPQVSVITTVRNGTAYLDALVESVRSQSLADWEWIIVDDGSTDRTPEILESLAATDHRIRLVRAGRIGRGRALNLAIEQSSAPLIAIIDADDVAHPERLERQAAVLRSRPTFALLATQTVFFRADQPVWPSLPAGESAPVRDVTASVAYGNSIVHSSVMMRRDALLAVGGYDASRSGQFDYDLWVRLVAAGYRLGFLEAPLAGKRFHDNQAFEKRNRLRYLLGAARIQARAIRVGRAGPASWLVLLGRFCWGMLPGYLRNWVRSRFWKVSVDATPATRS